MLSDLDKCNMPLEKKKQMNYIKLKLNSHNRHFLKAYPNINCTLNLSVIN